MPSANAGATMGYAGGRRMTQQSRNQREGRYAGRFKGQNRRTWWVPEIIGLSKAQWKLHVEHNKKKSMEVFKELVGDI
jgi:hypothetical protein